MLMSQILLVYLKMGEDKVSLLLLRTPVRLLFKKKQQWKKREL